jgi:hypothetical protein
VHQECVLLILSIIALLGDNPMQSKLACHIGSMGKFFCQICQVKGSDSGGGAPVEGRDVRIPEVRYDSVGSAAEVSDTGSEGGIVA